MYTCNDNSSHFRCIYFSWGQQILPEIADAHFVIYIASTPSPDFIFSSFCAFMHELVKKVFKIFFGNVFILVTKGIYYTIATCM